MRRRDAFAAAVLPLAAAGLLAGSAFAADAPIVAHLTAVAPAHGGSGRFSATVVSSKSMTSVDWKLSVSHLSGPVTAATPDLRQQRGQAPALPAVHVNARRPS